MVKKLHKRILAVVLAVIMTVSAAVITTATVSAAEQLVPVTLCDIARRYSEAQSLLDLCNKYRKSKGLTEWTLDTETEETAMKRAAELSLYASYESPDGSIYTESASKGQIIGYDYFSLNVLMNDIQSNEATAKVLNSTAVTAGVGVVSVDSVKYAVILVNNKTAVPVDAAVMAQTSVAATESINTRISLIEDAYSEYPSNQFVLCGTSVEMRMKVKNKGYTNGFAYITSGNMVVKSSNEDYFKVNGTMINAVYPGKSTISVWLSDAPNIVVSNVFKAIGYDLSECKIADIEDQIYTGDPLRPGVVVTDASGKQLILGTDYRVSYTNNIEIGTATVTVTGIGSYAGSSISKNFNIIESPYGSYKVTATVDYATICTGETATMKASVSGGTSPITYTFDYAKYDTADWKTLKNASTSSCTFTPNATGKFNLRVKAVDNDGKVSTAVKTITVGQQLSVSVSGASAINLGEAYTIKTTASGGVYPLIYSCYVKKTTDSSYTTVSSYSVTGSFTYTPKTAGQYEMYVSVKSATGYTQKATQYFTVKQSKLANTSTISATSIAFGSSFNVAAAATGGTSPYTYAVYYKKSTDTKWATKQDFKTNKSVTIKPGAATKYDVRVTVKDAAGTQADKSFTVNVTSASLVNTSKISSSAIALGDKVTVTALATGGTAPYTYAVYYKKSTDTKWATKQDFKENASVAIKPGAATAYVVRVTAKDADNKTASKDFTLKVTAESLKNNSKISATSIALGQSVTVTAAASGGASPYQYAVFYKKTTESSWATAQSYGKSAKVTVEPGTSTSYDIRVKVKDDNGSIASKDFTVNVTGSKLTNKSSLSASTITLGQSVTVKAAASGGTSPYQYAVFYKKSGETDWACAQSYGTSAKVTIKPGKATVYNIRIKVKDSNHIIASKDLSVSVVPVLKNTSKISSSSVVLGNTVTVTAAATGGSAPYSYAVFYKKSSETGWACAQEYGKNTKVSVKPGTATVYNIRVKVKDSRGTISSKDFTVTAAAALKNTSKISSTSITVGETVTVTAAATGGTSPYTYAVFYKKTTETGWACAQNYGTGTKISVKPGTAAVYNIRVKVKDSKGTLSSKDFTVTAVAALKNNSKISSTSIKLGSTVTVTAAATGGTSPYTYAVFYKKTTETAWACAQSYGTETSVVIKPGTAASYDVRVKVKDSKGTISSKDFTVTVTK